MPREKKVDDAEGSEKNMADETEKEKKAEGQKISDVVDEGPAEESEAALVTPAPKEALTEDKVIQTIVLGSDWQEALAQLVTEEGLNPEDVDLLRLTDVFMGYLRRLQTFDFRIPARFVLIAAILLRMKTELLLEEEEKKALQEKHVEPLNIDVPLLTPPAIRQPTRKVTLSELITALNKAFEFREKKETKELRMRDAIENLIERPKEDIEARIRRIYARIVETRKITFTELVPVWKRKDIIDTFIPLLYLDQRGLVVCQQDDMFKEIYISIRAEEPKTEGPRGQEVAGQ